MLITCMEVIDFRELIAFKVERGILALIILASGQYVNIVAEWKCIGCWRGVLGSIADGSVELEIYNQGIHRFEMFLSIIQL